MPLSEYGRERYAMVIAGQISAPALYLALCEKVPSFTDTPATMDEIGLPRMALAGSWSTMGGHAVYDEDIVVTVTPSDWSGIVNGYALCDAPSAGNMLFYGSLTPFELTGERLFLTLTGISVEVT